MITQNQLSDTLLIKNYVAGDNEAIGVLLERYKAKIYNYILMLTKDEFLSDDILQEVFIKIFSFLKEGRYNDDGRFLQWALRIAHNKVIDYYRFQKSQKTVSTDEENSPVLFDKTLVDSNIEDQMVKDQVCLDIRKLVDALPFEQREVVLLRHYLDMSFKEIAKQTGVSINTALGRMRYALINLRKMIEENNITIDVSLIS